MRIYKDKNLKWFLMVFLFFSNISLAEMWPTLENYVNDCVLIVKAQTNVTKEGDFVFRVFESWKGQYELNDFLRTTEDGYFYTFKGEHGVDVIDGQEIIYFFTKNNQSIENKISSHSTAFPIRDGKIIYAATNKGLKKEYTVEKFKEQIFALQGNESEIIRNMVNTETEDGWKYNEDISEPEWSPDGKYILFNRSLSKYIEKYKTYHGREEIWISSEDGKNISRLTDGTKLFWSGPDDLVYTYATKESEKTISHFAIINIKTGEIKQFKEKPSFATIRFKFNNKTFSILNTKAYNWHQADEQRILFYNQFEEQSRQIGIYLSEIDIHKSIMLLTQSYFPADGGYGTDVIYIKSNNLKQREEIVTNARNPSLSNDGLKLLFVRDKNLWIKKFEKPLEPNVSVFKNERK